ncbi:hypothetical protein [Streptomyces sp. NPDC093094]|uniref:hypothetical protein n=1 Tax=Streptomyces sp. NPDC093094 TaxID=3366026 RepID=UPI0038093105
MTSSEAGHPDEGSAPGRPHGDAGAPIYDELVRAWRAAGREVPRPPQDLAGGEPPEPQDRFGRG